MILTEHLTTSVSSWSAVALQLESRTCPHVRAWRTDTSGSGHGYSNCIALPVELTDLKSLGLRISFKL